MRENFSAVLARITGPEIALVLLGFAGIHLGGMLKWRMLVRSTGVPLSFVYAAQCYATGLFGNIFLPSNIGGDMLSTGMVMRRADNKLGVVMATLASRLFDLAALLAIGLTGMLHPRTWALVSNNTEQWAVGLVLVALCAFAARPFIRIPRFVRFRTRRRLVSVRRVVRSMAARPRNFVIAFGTSLALQTGLLLLNFWVGLLCGLKVPVAAWLFAWPIAKLIAFIPVSQGGFGTREFALAALLAPFSARPELVVAVGLVWDVLLVIAGLAGGLIALILARISANPDARVRAAARRGTA
jgi:uncharacterized protein (TIRG00374 family)